MKNESRNKHRNEQILIMIRGGFEFATISRQLDVGYNVIARLFYKDIIKKVKVRPEPVIKVVPIRERFYKTEENIENELNIFDKTIQSYDAKDLEGMEKHILNNIKVELLEKYI